MESGKRILIADDDPDIIDLLESYFKRAGFIVTAKINGKDALQKAQAEKFDLILQDPVVYASQRIDITDKVTKALADK